MDDHKLRQLIIQKYTQQKLGHFLIIEPNIKDEIEYCLNWAKLTVEQITKISDLSNHQDIMLLSPPKDKKNFAMDDLSLIGQFMHHQPHELSTKFLIINQAHALSDTHLNKLLKLLEEPPIRLHVILINETKTSLLSTIYSRAIMLKLQLPENSEINFLSSLMQHEISFVQFCKLLDDQKIEISTLMSNMLELVNCSNIDFKQLVAFQQQIKNIEQDLTYHNSLGSIRVKLFHLFTNISQAR